MMRKYIFVLLAALLPLLAGAGTLDDIAQLEQGKPGDDAKSVSPPDPVTGSTGSEPAAPTATPPAPASTAPGERSGPVWFHLADGRVADVSHWQIVHFLRSDCPFCHRFNPVLKAVAGQAGLKIFVYSFDGKGDEVFPQVVPVNPDVVNAFFAELPQRTPTEFLINTQSLVTIPLSQGEVTGEALAQRLSESFALAIRLGVL